MINKSPGWLRTKASYAIATAIFISALIQVGWASAQTPPAQSPSDSIVFRAYAEHGLDATVQLVNGVKAIKQFWPTILNASLPSKVAGARSTCTAVLIGPGVFLTAAHCFDLGPGYPLLDSAWIAIGDQAPLAKCTLSPEYVYAVEHGVWNFVKPRVSEDYALCAFDLPAHLPSAMQDPQYDNIDVKEGLTQGSPVLMTGFGCSDRAILLTPQAGNVQLDGLLRLGDASITSMPALSDSDAEQFVKIASSLESAPALCRGDSGGPLYTGATTTQQNGTRVVRGVNSSVDVPRGATAVSIAVSRITPLATQRFRTFVASWLADHKTSVICGVNAQSGFSPCHD
ncbi:trypsin [Paraburkholderia sp. BL18I3N2]|uniref:trypsin-like serine peptidase n=1 Tax=Paraburkholderia sp. BL18I3N2 TaxID=1938799 RepID=UPI000D07B3AB|nr:trypsin-like serine protease [Paraburkholderia sp. BL18I3N2]PRX34219.1 trypsin [Paraburkholderia sp. BL18I3N2]